MRLLRFILPALLTLIAGACSRVRPELTRADALMEADADSALTLLCAIDTASLTSAEHPLYALLLTQAQIKTNATVTSDSLIAQAYRAYRFSPDANLRLRAHFYAAFVAFYREDYPEAMRKMVAAYEIARELEDDKWIARTSELMADIFAEVYNYDQSVKFRRQAIDHYAMAGMIPNHRYAICDLASYHINTGNFNAAITSLDSLRNVIAKDGDNDSPLERYATNVLMAALADAHDFNRLERLLSQYNCGDTAEFYISSGIYESYLASDRDDDRAVSTALLKAYGAAEKDKERIRILYADYCNSMSKGNYHEAALMADTLLIMQSSIAESVLNESVTTIQRDFYENLEINNRQQYQRKLRTLLAIITLALLSIALILLFYKERIRAKRAELQANLAELTRIQAVVEERNSAIEERNNTIGARNAVILERNAVIEERNAVIEERNAVIEERNAVIEERNAVIEERNAVIEERNAVIEERNAVIENLFRDKWSVFNRLCSIYIGMDGNKLAPKVVSERIKKELQDLRKPKSLFQIEQTVNIYRGNIMNIIRSECNNILSEKDFELLPLILSGLSTKIIAMLVGMEADNVYKRKYRIIDKVQKSDAPSKDLIIQKINNSTGENASEQ